MNDVQNLNLIPENYIYNHYSEEADIEKIVEEILLVGENREKFDLIMKQLERKFMDGEEVSEDEGGIKKAKKSVMKQATDKQISFHNIQKPQSNSNLNKDYEYSHHTMNSHLYKSENKNFIQKKYTDVHANTKFYYRDQSEDDMSLEKSQWTDRANTNTIYHRQNSSFSTTSNMNRFFDDNTERSENRRNYQVNQLKFQRDNTNSSLYNMNIPYNKYK